MKKGTAKAVKYIAAGSVLMLGVIMTGCGCGQKKTDPASEQVLKISITPEPSPTPAPDTVDASAVTANGDISMVNLYVAENPSAATGSTTADATDTSGSDALDGQDQSEDMSDSSDDQSYDESADENYDDSSDDGSYDEGSDSEE